MWLKFMLLAIGGITLAHLKGVVVVYLRKALGFKEKDSNIDFLQRFPEKYLLIERTREVVTTIKTLQKIPRSIKSKKYQTKQEDKNV